MPAHIRSWVYGGMDVPQDDGHINMADTTSVDAASAESTAIAAHSARLTEQADTRQRIRAIVGASSGNLVEWFDFYIYSFCALYFAPLFS